MKKIVLSFLLIVYVVSILSSVNATGFLNDVLNQAGNFTGTSSTMGTNIESFIKGTVIPIISLIGNLVIACVTVILGVKYIWSSADGKAQVSQSLPAFVVGVIFFYLGEVLVNYLTGATFFITTANNWNKISGPIMGTVNLVVQIAAFGGILFLGLKYMFASAEGKSRIKTSYGAFVLGLLLVFSASKVVDYILAISQDVLK